MLSMTARTHPDLWAKVVEAIRAGHKGGNPGQWSARKAQLAVHAYKSAGGGYLGPLSPDNSLVRWTRQRWRTSSGRPSRETGERYLPAAAFAHLSASEIDQTNRVKSAATLRGLQYSRQPRLIAAKVAKFRTA